MASWPPGFTIRAPRPDEEQAITDLIVARNLADHGEPEWDIEDLRSDWKRLGFELERDARVVVAPDGRLVAYADVHARPNKVQVGESSLIHPDYLGMQLEQPFVALVESLAAQHALPSVVWMREVGRSAPLVERGYTPARYLWQMRIEFDAPPPPAVWPKGYAVRIMQEADEREAHALIDTAFTRPDRAPVPFDEWRRFIVERADFDRSLAFIAVGGEEIVGAAMSREYHDPDEGWVQQLVVAEGHRGKGLGATLLRHAFAEFYRRGITRVGLGVDANNPSATKLYKGVGMTAVRQYIEYAKPA